jgi:Ser/Thr protein kinase RdoA (MazF antagonist)
MRVAVHVKPYPDPSRRIAAHGHLQWLHGLGADVRLPVEHEGTPARLVLEHLPGRHAAPADLISVADALGRLHGTAYVKDLHAARLDCDHDTTDGLTIPSFQAGREHVLMHYPVDHGRPVAFYKDTNLRNVVVSESGPALVDFDDLTLAPFGYDLAKLIVSLAMTHGRLKPAHVAAALTAYVSAVQRTSGPANACTTDELRRYAELHHLLTVRYLRRNGYRHTWTDVRPWPTPPPTQKELSDVGRHRSVPRPPR